MPVKIQELVIQTKLKTINSPSIDNTQPKVVSQQELQKFERRLQYVCMESIRNILRAQQER